ncbi:MAG: glycosyltransferase family 9 protein [Minisyncoccia bacterium]
MSKILIVKIGALGDVVRTTPILRVLKGNIFWISSKKAIPLLPKLERLKTFTEEQIDRLQKINFDLILNLEEDEEISKNIAKLKTKKLIGVYFDFKKNRLSYTKETPKWYDMSLISKYGKERANELKWKNKKTYQEILFEMLGFKFKGEEYLLNYNKTKKSVLKNKKIVVVLEKRAGEKWPIKKWPYYHILKKKLEKEGYNVFYLKQRKNVLDYMKDIDKCNILICGDTLAMHLGLYLKKRIIALFICTSPWEIYDYGRMIKVINPYLKDAFYRRDYNKKLVSGIKIEDVYKAFQKAVGNF